LLTGCNTTESDWKAAKAADTSSAYTGFLARHPNGPHAFEAEAAIENLDWKEASSANTSAAYAAFLARHSHESHAGDAIAAKAASEKTVWTAGEWDSIGTARYEDVTKDGIITKDRGFFHFVKETTFCDAKNQRIPWDAKPGDFVVVLRKRPFKGRDWDVIAAQRGREGMSFRFARPYVKVYTVCGLQFEE
jgi:hypothetical protein